jgi:hypothetical protein
MTERDSVDGMTVNERLFHFGLFDKFDSAVRARDSERLVQVLLLAKLSEEAAMQTATTVLANPKHYGF